jgi:hypothetical protein
MTQLWSKTMASVVGVVALGSAALGQCGPPPPPNPVVLAVPQATAFAVLGHSCGGIQQQGYATGFDATSGYPIGDAHLKTTCSAGGRGGHTVTYNAWLSASWDLTGALVSYTALGAAPTVDPAFSAFDAYGNHLYNQSNQAYLSLASAFVPAPRVSSVTPNSGPQGSIVTIAGTAFTNASAVDFGQLAAVIFTVNGDTSITAVTPAVRTGTFDVTVTTGGGTSGTNTSDQFTFLATPRVTAVSPNQGTADGGTSVQITGVNFADANAVSFGGVPASFVVHGDTSITAVSPAGPDSAVTVDVTVTSADGSSALSTSDRYTYN